ncbi:Cellulose synthase family protein [Rhynchospora pubera]|uniref:Cellulose synthase family protein n=1 Tax=Rhynchospora pubera TaxID=906938 RepID=A0AAV8G7M4_9POAL|nr:Cellulose synthase family protein [Rhynchospora pubera]
MGDTSLFATEHARGRAAYRLYACTILAGICLILYYRATHIPATWREGRGEWIGLSLAELWHAFYWVITQSARWKLVYRRTFKDKLSQRFEGRLPNVDIFVCTADPYAEPPNLVVSTVLSLMAYNYPPEKLSVYLSDDGGSILTFYAMWEASQFAKHWIPFCKRYKLEPRAPAAYFSSSDSSSDMSRHEECSSMKILYEEMTSRVDAIVKSGKVPEELKANHKGFSQWQSEMTSKKHPPIVQILIDGKDPNALDNVGNALPTFVYMAREKNPEYHHNFKAGAMNSLLRVSSVISNGPIILNVDCDMYSNNSDSIRDALCFFLDEEKGCDIAFVQYPQNYNNMTKNDTYGNSLSVMNEVDLCGFDSWGGPPYIGTGCFHRRESLCGMKHTKDYKEDWNRGSERNPPDDIRKLEEKAESLATCTYELNTLWGHEVGLKYGIAVEDVMTGLMIQCRGWKSIYYNPPQKGFLGVGPTTLAQTILQHKRWGEGNLQIFLSKYCTFIYGHGKIKLALQMAYCINTLWAANSVPTLYYVIVPSLSLLRGISLFPKMTSPWFIPFSYVMVGKQTYSLIEALLTREITVHGWWNLQRMWLIKRLTSYLYATLATLLKNLGVSKMGFIISAKISGEDASKRYEQEIMEFDASSLTLAIIEFVALLNLACLVCATSRAVMMGWAIVLDMYFLQILLCGLVVAINVAIYEGLLLRKDKGSIPWSVTLTTLGFVMLVSLVSIV